MLDATQNQHQHIKRVAGPQNHSILAGDVNSTSSLSTKQQGGSGQNPLWQEPR